MPMLEKTAPSLERRESRLGRAELPDDSGDSIGRIELPDDSGDSVGRMELPDDSGEKRPENLEDKEKAEDDNPEKRMEPPAVVYFRCPQDCDKKEFERQLSGQQDGMNNLSLARFLKNRENYENNGRNIEAGSAAQHRVRETAREDKIAELRSQNPELSRQGAEKKADEWLRTQAALHDPDQIAGGEADNVTGVGDAKVNSSIGVQWKNKISNVDEAVQAYIKEANLSAEDCEIIKLNVQLKAIS